MRDRKGFTLVEVLAALAVVAFALAALWKGLGQGITVSQGLPDRLMARWVADNRLVLRQARGEWPDTRTFEGTTRMGGRKWAWEEEVRSTDEEGLRRVTVRVRPEGEEGASQVTLEGFLRKPRATDEAGSS